MKFSTFGKNVVSVFRAAVLAQVIPMIGYIIIALFILPKEFGLFAIWLGIVQIISVISTLRLEISLFNEEDGVARDRSIILITYISLIVSLLMGFLLFIGYFLRPLSVENLSMVSWIFILPCAALFSIENNLRDWARADGRYDDLNKIRLAQAILVTSLQMVLILRSPTSDSLIIGQFIGCLLGLIYANHLKPLRFFFHKEIFQEIKSYIYKHKRFITYTFPADAISTFLAQLPLWVFGSRFGLEASGYLALALRTMKVPAALLGNSIQDVFIRQAMNDLNLYGNCMILFKRTFSFLFLGAVAFFAVSFLLIEELFILFFGEIWATAGLYAFYLSPLFAFGFISSPLSILTLIIKRQDIDFIWHLFLLPLVFLSFLIPSSDTHVLITYVCTFSFMHIIYTFLTYRLSLGGYVFDLHKS